MKIEISEDYTFILKDVFSGVLFRTEEGEEMGVAMRDGAFEIYLKDLSAKGQDCFTPYTVSSKGVFPMACSDTVNDSERTDNP